MSELLIYGIIAVTVMVVGFIILIIHRCHRKQIMWKGARLVILTGEGATRAEYKIKKVKGNTIVVDEGFRPVKTDGFTIDRYTIDR